MSKNLQRRSLRQSTSNRAPWSSPWPSKSSGQALTMTTRIVLAAIVVAVVVTNIVAAALLLQRPCRYQLPDSNDNKNIPESGISFVHTASNIASLKQCDIPIVMGTHMAGTRALLANIYSTILNYDDVHRNLCIFVFALSEDYILRQSSLMCAFGNEPLPPNVQIITKLISKAAWHPSIFSANLQHRNDLNSDYNWFRYYLKPAELGGTSSRYIWLDTDILVRGNVAELYDFNLQGRVAAAGVYDVMPLSNYLIKTNKEQLDQIPMTDQNISPLQVTGHLNCGLLVIDLEQMERQGILHEWSRLQQIHDQTPLWKLDQAAFTLAIHGKFERLPREWNVGELGWLDGLTGIIGKDAVARHVRKCQTAKALHWNGLHKPWNDVNRIAGCPKLWQEYDIVMLQHKQQCLLRDEDSPWSIFC